MSQQTRSEALFEEACEKLGVPFRRIRPAARRRPDYKVSIAAGKIVVEVKEVGPNAIDKEYERQRESKGWSFGGVPLGRLRPLVADANRQLRPWVMRRIPGLVAVYDTNPFQLYTEDHHVRALFGEPAISITLDGKAAAQDSVLATNQILTNQKNRSVSAVVTIREVYQARTILTLFHNPFARLPLVRGCGNQFGIREVDYRVEYL